MSFSKPKKPGKKINFSWQVLDTPPGLFWFKMLVKLSRSNKTYFPRFTGFISPHKTMAMLSQNLNMCIEVINSEGHYNISERASGEFCQDFSNIIHHHFEILQGSRDKKTDFYNSSSREVQCAIGGLNQHIHDMETLKRALDAKGSGGIAAAALILESFRIDRFKIPETFFDYFGMNFDFGDIVLHYSQVGKTWWEVFNDRDQEIFPKAILPLSEFSAEMDVFFYDFKISEKMRHQFHNFLLQHQQDPGDKKLALGYLPLARFMNENSLSQSKIRELLGEHLSFDKLSIYKHNDLLGEISSDLSLYALDRPELS